MTEQSSLHLLLHDKLNRLIHCAKSITKRCLADWLAQLVVHWVGFHPLVPGVHMWCDCRHKVGLGGFLICICFIYLCRCCKPHISTKKMGSKPGSCMNCVGHYASAVCTHTLVYILESKKNMP